ncbi:uncharacterized protein LOC133797887 [Humulus lupulus]|uniref:uncharacterized protein LOC133797887 n=1 Tax=Humulus lupulus TaxID=3486 RepID=UPI002B411F9F|nr:uncharacterized protein LOC133797887 [Humulus lupulus]
MEDLCSPFNWDSRHEEEGMEELWYSLLCTTVELETKVESTKEEITKKEDELLMLNDFLSRAIKEKEEAELNCQSIMLDIVTLKKQLHQTQKEKPSAAHNGLGEPTKESQNHFVDQIFASCCETNKENEVSKESCEDNNMDSVLHPTLSSSPCSSLSSELPPSAEKLVAGKPLPEKGKLLQAVMEAGPLLQTLLLAGPLPQWQHPPPRINCVEIPPVAISRPPTHNFLGQEDYSCLSHKKRSLPHYEGYGFSSNTKFQKVVLY